MEGYDYKLAYDYTEMFRGLLADYPYFSRHVKEEIGWAKQHLRKRDRITWYLRWIRLYDYNAVATGLFTNTPQYQQVHGPAKPFDLQMVDKYEQLVRKESAKLGHASAPILSRELVESHARKQELLDHYLGLPVPEIQNLVWDRQAPSYLFATFHDMEAQWKEETKGVLQPRPGDRPAITFGDGWAWWMLDRGYCEEEARAMGHCGNVAGIRRPYERILSLRKSVRRGEREYYEPHLTFILDTRDSSLGEMKGKGNDKPAPQYHPYILRLLESDIVDKVKGGGYLPEHNFKLGDLSEEQREELSQKKPSMATFYLRFRKEGASPGLVADVGSAIQAGAWDPDLRGYVVNQWGDMAALAEDIGNDTAKWIAKVVGKGDFLDFDYGDPNEAIKQALDACSDRTRDLVVRYLAYTHPTKLVEWLEHNNTDYSEQATGFMRKDPGEPQARRWLSRLNLNMEGVLGTDDIAEFIEFAGLDEERGSLLSAWSDATEAGTEAEMGRDFERAASDILDTAFPWGTTLRKKGKYFWDDPVYEVMSLDKAVEVADSGESAGNYMEANGRYDSEEFGLKVDEPHYGYQGWDEQAADERVSEAFALKEEPEKKPRKPARPKAPARPRKKKSADGDTGERPARPWTVTAAAVPDQAQSPAFKAWFRGSVVRYPDGRPKPVYHGSTHSFEAFSLKPSNPENWYGRALYFTDSPEDVGRNYATPESPDLQRRIDFRTEQLLERVVDELEQELGEAIGWNDPRRDRLEEDARSQAAKELTGPAAMTYKLYLRIERPVVIRKGGGTYFEINYNERTGAETGSGMRLYRAVMKAAGQLGLDGQKIWGEATEERYEGFTAHQFEESLRVSDSMLEARDWDQTDEGDFLSLVYRLAGFDGIVMEDAGATFQNMGIPPGTTHYTVWNPRQVKSAWGNVGTWSGRSPRMTASWEEEGPEAEDYPQCIGDYEFRTTCVSEGTGEHIQEMLDNAKDCGYSEVKRHCEGLRQWERDNGYAPDGSRKGLTLRKDWSVGYGKGAYRGVPCYFVVWSGIEHVWTRKGVTAAQAEAEEVTWSRPLYHATSVYRARKIKQTQGFDTDRARGYDEMGRGVYAHPSMNRTAPWAKGRGAFLEIHFARPLRLAVKGRAMPGQRELSDQGFDGVYDRHGVTQVPHQVLLFNHPVLSPGSPAGRRLSGLVDWPRTRVIPFREHGYLKGLESPEEGQFYRGASVPDVPPEELFYHYSRRTNRRSIRENGLAPQIKEYRDIDREPGVYLFSTLEMAESYGQDHAEYVNQPVDIWEVRLPRGARLEADEHPDMVGYDAFVCYDPIPPENLRFVSTILLRPKMAQAAAEPGEAGDKEWTPWIGVDLDGTLAEEQDPFDPLTIGKPVPEMVEKVKKALEDGVEVRVFTARLADEKLRGQIREKIREYTREHIGRELDSTSEKDPGLREIWDDKARRVRKDEGTFALRGSPGKTARRKDYLLDAGWIDEDGRYYPCMQGEHHGEAAVREHLVDAGPAYEDLYDEEGGELDSDALSDMVEQAMDLGNVRVSGHPFTEFDAMWDNVRTRSNIARAIRDNPGLQRVDIEFHRPEHTYMRDLQPQEALRWMQSGERPEQGGKVGALSPGIKIVSRGVMLEAKSRYGRAGGELVDAAGLAGWKEENGLHEDDYEDDYEEGEDRYQDEEDLLRAKTKSFTLLGMEVNPRHRRKGIGTALAMALLQAAKAAGATECWLHASPLDDVTEEEDLVSFYRSLGFETYSEDGQIMYKPLAGTGEKQAAKRLRMPLSKGEWQELAENGGWVRNDGEPIPMYSPTDMHGEAGSHAKRVESLRESWADPFSRLSRMKAFDNGSFRGKIGEISRKRWNDPKKRAKQSTTLKETWNDPEYRTKMSNFAKAEVRDTDGRFVRALPINSQTHL